MSERRRWETGFVAVSGAAAEARRWVADGAAPAYVVEAPSWWTLVAPLPQTGLPEPYDHPSALVAGRRLPRALLPAFGVFVVGDRAVLTLQTSALLHRIRWSCWSPGRGAEPLHRLAPLAPVRLVRAAPEPVTDALPRLERAFRRREGTAERFLRQVLAALGLPGEDLLRDPGSVRSLAGAELVTPTPDAQERFAHATKERMELRAERGTEDA